jgi:hypothetical protein
MKIEMRPVDPGGAPVGGGRGPAARAARSAAEDPAVTIDTAPATPPPDLAAEMEVAARRYDELQEQNRELHFEMHDGRLVVQVRDTDGNVIREVPPSAVLDVAAGGPLD